MALDYETLEKLHLVVEELDLLLQRVLLLEDLTLILTAIWGASPRLSRADRGLHLRMLHRAYLVLDLRQLLLLLALESLQLTSEHLLNILLADLLQLVSLTEHPVPHVSVDCLEFLFRVV